MAAPIPMKTTDRARLLTDLAYRVDFDRDFIGFTADDAAVLNGAAPLVIPMVNDLVAGVYNHLFGWSYTKEVFLKRSKGYKDGTQTDIDLFTQDDPVIKYRKKFLSMWVSKVFTADYADPKMWEYLDKVGIMHTGVAGFKHRENKEALLVDLQACSLLLGWVADVVISIVMGIPEATVPAQAKCDLIRAFSKIMWIQQDLFQRHYVRSDKEAAVYLAKVLKGEADAKNAALDYEDSKEDEALAEVNAAIEKVKLAVK